MDDLEKNGPIDGYEVSWREAESNVNTSSIIYSASVFSYTVDKIQDYKAYELCVRAYNSLEYEKLFSPWSCINKPGIDDSEFY